jgi:uncharacterized protein GlcG (DUF336 family)
LRESAESGSPASLSLSLATDVLTETVNACVVKGYKVAVTIVDPDGVVKLS